jgi:hypothetical protein
MNGQTQQNNQNGKASNTYQSEPTWYKADPYTPETPYDPAPSCSELPDCEGDPRELWILLNSVHSLQQTSRLISTLAWALFGLGSLLVVGSLLMAWTYPRVTNTNTTKEIVNTTTTTKETSSKDTVKDVSNDYNYYHPRGLW